MLKKKLGDQSHLEIFKGRYGKLYIRDRSYDFNISHSDDYVVGIISKYDIGIDIENICNVSKEKLRRFFCKEEINYCNSAIDTCKIWTLKESYLKCIGLGLNVPLNSFSVITNDKMLLSINGNENMYYSFSSKKIDNYVISVCTTQCNIPNIDYEYKEIKELVY